MNQKLLALYGLKYNPFIPEVPIEASAPRQNESSITQQKKPGLVTGLRA